MSLTDLARRMFRKAAPQPRSPKPRRSPRLTVTALEDRVVPTAICGLVFYDTNADGIQNNNEMTAPGVAVSYTPMMGGSTVSGNTDGLGHYTFTEIAPGSYTVAFTAPTGYSVGTPMGGSTMVYVGTENVNVGAGLVANSGGTGNSTRIEAETDTVIKGEPTTFDLISELNPAPNYTSIEWDFNSSMMGTFHADATGSDWFATTTFTTTGMRTVAARLTDSTGSVQIVSLGITVENPPPVLTLPTVDVLATAGTPLTLPVSATSESGIASAEWWFSYDNEEYVEDPTVTVVSPSYTFELAGEYDAWVVVTDSAGKSSEGGFHISVADAAPVEQVQITTLSGGSVANGIDEGSSVTFTLNDLSTDDLDTTTVYVDWAGDGVFDQLNESGVDFRIDPNNPKKVSFDHRYDQDSGAGAFQPKIRLEDEFGLYDYGDPLNLKVKNVAPTIAVTAGQQFANKEISGQDVWAIKPGQNLEIVAFDPSNADTAALVYHWTVTDEATGQVTAVPIAGGNPGGSAFLALPSYQAGKIYKVEAWVTDNRVVDTPHTSFTAVVDDPQGYGGGPGVAAGSHWLPNKVYGTLKVDTVTPTLYNRYAQDVLINPPLDSAHPKAPNWGNGQAITAHFQLDPASLTLSQQSGVTVDYRYTVTVFNVEHTYFGGDHFDLLPAESFFADGPGNTLIISGYGVDREIHIIASADLRQNGQVIQTTSAADFIRNANGDYGLAGALHQPTAVFITPKTSTYWQQAIDTYQAVKDLAQQFGVEPAQKLIAALGDPGRVFRILTEGLKGAITEFGNNLPSTLGNQLAAWLGGGIDLSKFAGANWGDSSTWSNFLLQYSGLTWDHLYDVVRQQLGAGNLAALDQVATWFNGIDTTQAGSIRQFLTNLPDFDMEALATKLAGEVTNRVPAALARAGAQLAAKFVPGAGLAISLYDGLKWVLDNKVELEAVFTKFVSVIDDLSNANETVAIAEVQRKLVDGFTAVLPKLLDLGASQLGLGRLKDEVKKAISFVPTKIDEAIRKAVDTVASTVLALPGFAAVPGGTKADNLFVGILAPAKEFMYPAVGGKTYVLWAAQDKVGAKVFIAEKNNGTYKLVSELTAKSFAGTLPIADITDFIAKAKALHSASKTKPQSPANPNAIPDLRIKQAAVTLAEEEVRKDIVANACVALNAGCFAAGTKLWTPDGYRTVEEIQPDEFVYARNEYDPNGPIEAKRVEAKFERTGCILHIHGPAGELIRTTPEHPFFDRTRGWTAAGALSVGDEIRTDTGWMRVADLLDTELYEKVYNIRVADHHTYFVGDNSWGESVWAHNICAPVFIRNGSDLTTLLATNPQLRPMFQQAQAFRHDNHHYMRNWAIAMGTKGGQVVYASALSAGSSNHSERSIYGEIQSWDTISAYFSERVPCDKCRNPTETPSAPN